MVDKPAVVTMIDDVKSHLAQGGQAVAELIAKRDRMTDEIELLVKRNKMLEQLAELLAHYHDGDVPDSIPL